MTDTPAAIARLTAYAEARARLKAFADARTNGTIVYVDGFIHNLTVYDLVPLDLSDLRAVLGEIERLRGDVADLKVSVIAFGGPSMVEYAKERGLPKGHLFDLHYDILANAGARMTSFTRHVSTPPVSA